MDGNRDGEGSGEGTKGVAVEEGGRSSLKRTCDDLDFDETEGMLSSSLHTLSVISSIVSALARMFRILWIN